MKAPATILVLLALIFLLPLPLLAQVAEEEAVEDTDPEVTAVDDDKAKEMVGFGATGGGRMAIVWVDPETIQVQSPEGVDNGHGLGAGDGSPAPAGGRGLDPVPHNSGRRYVIDEARAQVAQQIFKVG